jgi:hypothetical protein
MNSEMHQDRPAGAERTRDGRASHPVPGDAAGDADAAPAAPAKRRPGFQPGNPGRPKGSRNRVTRAIQDMLDGEHEKLTRTVIDWALEGDLGAMRLCFDRLAPPRRDMPVTIDLPPVRSTQDTADASAAVLAALAAGDVTPNEASRVLDLLARHVQILEAGEFEQRLCKVEEQLEARKRQSGFGPG